MTSRRPEEAKASLDAASRACAKEKAEVPAAHATRGPGKGDTSLIAGVPATAGHPFETLPVEFGRYRVEKLLGSGAMGAVYLARDSQLDRRVALKVPKLSRSG